MLIEDKIPVVELRLRGIKAQVLTVVEGFSHEIESMCNDTIDKAIKNFDYEHEIQKVMNEVIRDAIKKAIYDSMNPYNNDNSIQTIIRDSLLKYLTDNPERLDKIIVNSIDSIFK